MLSNATCLPPISRLSHTSYTTLYSYHYTEGGASLPFGTQVLDAKLHEAHPSQLVHMDPSMLSVINDAAAHFDGSSLHQGGAHAAGGYAGRVGTPHVILQ
jgi:hypothetical protein